MIFHGDTKYVAMACPVVHGLTGQPADRLSWMVQGAYCNPTCDTAMAERSSLRLETPKKS